MSNGAITFPIKLSEAINLYAKNKSFTSMSVHNQQRHLLPYKTMDLMEAQLKNLDIQNTSDNMSNSLKVVRRNSQTQKDFFSMAEYLVWAVNQYFEMEYYKKRKKKQKGLRTIGYIN